MNVSSVSPERWLMTAVQPARWRQVDRLERLRQRADLVELDECAVRGVRAIAAPNALRVGDEEVVADKLAASPRRARQSGPAVPVVFGEAIFDRAIGYFSTHDAQWSIISSLRQRSALLGEVVRHRSGRAPSRPGRAR